MYYASKALLTSAVARWALAETRRRHRLRWELAVALAAGVPGERIALHGNNKSAAVDHHRAARRCGAHRGGLPRGDRAGGRARAGARHRAPVMVRATPGCTPPTHEFIATAHEDQKFGLLLAAGAEGEDSPALQAVVSCLDAADALDLRGLHCHTGSQIFAARDSPRRPSAWRCGRPWPPAGTWCCRGGPRRRTRGRLHRRRTPRAVSRRSRRTSPLPAVLESSALPAPHLLLRAWSIHRGARGLDGVHRGHRQDPRLSRACSAATSPWTADAASKARPVLYGRTTPRCSPTGGPHEAPVLSRVVGSTASPVTRWSRTSTSPGTSSGRPPAVPVTGAYCWSLSSNYNWLPRPASWPWARAAPPGRSCRESGGCLPGTAKSDRSARS
ncbi:diaminopimelate decarboxylase [Kocuria rhizophila]|nr:diaminopimelate decarboxylase [Kocuria rhizophila]